MERAGAREPLSVAPRTFKGRFDLSPAKFSRQPAMASAS